MGILSWIIFGALAGWIASIIAGTNRRQGLFADIIVGVAGAFVGGFLWQLLSGSRVYFSWDVTSFIVAVVGALLLLAITGSTRRGRRRRRR